MGFWEVALRGEPLSHLRPKRRKKRRGQKRPSAATRQRQQIAKRKKEANDKILRQQRAEKERESLEKAKFRALTIPRRTKKAIKLRVAEGKAMRKARKSIRDDSW